MNVLRLFVVMAVLSAGRASASTIHVPSDYASIQDAIDAAAYGDTVLVAPGTYTDCPNGDCQPAVAVMREGLVLISESGPGATTLESRGPMSARVVDAAGIGSGGATVSGFRITGPTGQRTGLRGLDSIRLTIQDCVFEDLVWGVAVSTSNGEAIQISDCTFRSLGESDVPAIQVLDSFVTVERCTFEACVGGNIVSLSGGFVQSAVVRDCVFRANEGTVVLAILNLQNVLVERCELQDNVGEGISVGTIASGSAVIRDCVCVGGVGPARVAGGAVGPGRAEFLGNTAVGNAGIEPFSGAAFGLFSAEVVFRNNIVANTGGGVAVRVGDVGYLDEGCNVFWENEAAHFWGFEPDSTDRIVDPQFCDPDNRDYTLQTTSPCLPPQSLGCGLIGALGEGCGAVSVSPISFGRIKAQFR